MNSPRWYAAVAGIAAGAAGLGLAQAVAAVLGAETTPLVALGDRVVDLTPGPVKEWAIDWFGTADKTVLIGTMLVVTAALFAMAGVLAASSLWLGEGVLVVLVAVDAAAVLANRSGDDTGLTALIGLLVGLLVAAALLWWLVRNVPTAPSRVVRDEIPVDSAPDPAFRPGLPRGEAPAGFERRKFLALATAIGGAGVVVGAGVPALLPGTTGRGNVRLPAPGTPAAAVPAGVDLDVAGLTPHLTPNPDFYRIDIALRPPRLDVADYRLRLHGLVDHPVELSFEDLLDLPLVERRVTLACVSNSVGGDLVGNASWLGVRLDDLLARAAPQSGADAVLSTGADGITIGTPLGALTDGRDALLAVGMNGEPLPVEHGFPVRMVVPGLYGYVSATKWLTDLEVTRFSDFSAYWTERGWSAQGPIKTATRIDVPAADEVEAGTVVVAGVAWAQHRGIERVEVRVDDGAWQPAELATLDSVDTWRQWRWEWEAEPGSHLLEARSIDGRGEVQTGKEASSVPDGATGWHAIEVTVN